MGLSAVSSRGLFRWQSTNKDGLRRSGGDKRSAHEALKAWLHKFRDEVSVDSFTELSDLAGLNGSHPQQCQSATTVHGHGDSCPNADASDTQMDVPATQVQSPSAEADSPAHLDGEDLPPATRQPPSLADVTWILEHDIHNWIRSPMPPQRYMPRVAQELISQCMLYLLQIMDQPPCAGAVEAALVLFMSSPLVLWPEPRRTNNRRLTPHARARIIRRRSALLLSGQWRSLIELSREYTHPAGA